MRHGNKNNHLGRTSSHRKALTKNMAAALILHKRIFTTIAKAKVLRQQIEPMVTKAVQASKAEDAGVATHKRRLVFSILQNKIAVHELFTNIAAQVGDRPGGYTRIVRTGFRKGDGAEMAMIEFVDYNDIYNATGTEGADAGKKSRRTRRKKSSAGAAVLGTASATVAATTVAEETVITETRVITETVQGIDQELLGLEDATTTDGEDA